MKNSHIFQAELMFSRNLVEMSSALRHTSTISLEACEIFHINAVFCRDPKHRDPNYVTQTTVTQTTMTQNTVTQTTMTQNTVTQNTVTQTT